jgi:gamma-butyrobetaine dioxygenase
MDIQSIAIKPSSVVIVWSNGERYEYPYIWLRDNDPDELHPDTKERTFDLTSVDIDLSPHMQSCTKRELVFRWQDKEEDSVYPAEWLIEHQLGKRRQDPAETKRISWTAGQMSEPKRFSASACQSSETTLLKALKTMRETGIVLIEGLDDDLLAGERFGDLIGFKRETNFGVTFDVESKPSPNNLAYTSGDLPLHTDLPNQDLVPGFQFLHCYRNDVKGGGSIFSDGLSACESLKEDQPELYQTLVDISVPWRFHDEESDLRQRRPVINLDTDGNFHSLTLNPHIADIPDLEADEMIRFYRAYQAIMRKTREAKQSIEYVLKKGEMVIFDNLRILHGRSAFDPDSGERHLRGFYIEHNEVKSKIRMLSK